jgi:hypothetical protein
MFLLPAAISPEIDKVFLQREEQNGVQETSRDNVTSSHPQLDVQDLHRQELPKLVWLLSGIHGNTMPQPPSGKGCPSSPGTTAIVIFRRPNSMLVTSHLRPWKLLVYAQLG